MINVNDDLYKKAVAYSLFLLGRREYSEKELRIKLTSKYNEEICQRVIDYLQANNYQSDERFTDMMIRSYASRGYGHKRILQELSCKGIYISNLDDYVMSNNIDFKDICRDVLKRKLKSNVDLSDYKIKAKLLRYLVSRGFEYDVCISVLSEYCNTDEY
jgi:regulatory protein